MAAFPPDLPQLLAEVENYASTVREVTGSGQDKALAVAKRHQQSKKSIRSLD